MYEIVKTIDGEWMILINGFQYGGEYDSSGAGNMTFPSQHEAATHLALLQSRQACAYNTTLTVKEL